MNTYIKRTVLILLMIAMLFLFSCSEEKDPSDTGYKAWLENCFDGAYYTYIEDNINGYCTLQYYLLPNSREDAETLENTAQVVCSDTLCMHNTESCPAYRKRNGTLLFVIDREESEKRGSPVLMYLDGNSLREYDVADNRVTELAKLDEKIHSTTEMWLYKGKIYLYGADGEMKGTFFCLNRNGKLLHTFTPEFSDTIAFLFLGLYRDHIYYQNPLGQFYRVDPDMTKEEYLFETDLLQGSGIADGYLYYCKDMRTEDIGHNTQAGLCTLYRRKIQNNGELGKEQAVDDRVYCSYFGPYMTIHDGVCLYCRAAENPVYVGTNYGEERIDGTRPEANFFYAEDGKLYTPDAATGKPKVVYDGIDGSVTMFKYADSDCAVCNVSKAVQIDGQWKWESADVYFDFKNKYSHVIREIPEIIYNPNPASFD